MRTLPKKLALVLVLGLSGLFLAACEQAPQEGSSDDATIKYEKAVEAEAAAAAPPGAQKADAQFSEGMSDDATIRHEAAVENEEAAAMPANTGGGY